VLEGVRRQRPNNARALFGLAEVGSKMARAITDKDRLEEELFASVQLYKEAAENASPQTEKWLMQRSYVAAAKILEFLDHTDDAAAALDLAVKIGDVPGGALAEAQQQLKKLQEKKANQ
jgi:Mn-dependent DtxR family transcriptional regulator